MHSTFGEFPFATATVCIRQDSAAMRHFVLELALIAGATWVQQCTFSLTAAVDKFPLVLNASREEQSAIAFPVPVAIFAFIAVAVFRQVFPFPRHLAFQPAATVLAAAFIIVYSFSTEITSFKVSYVN